MKTLVLTAAIALLTASCASIWNRVNHVPFQEDINRLLIPSGVPFVLWDCRMAGTTRTGSCELEISPKQLDAIRAYLNMGEGQHWGAGESSRASGFLQGSPCLDRHSASISEEVLTYLITGRPAQLRLAGGSQFEYLLIAVDPAGGNTCIEASYAYG